MSKQTETKSPGNSRWPKGISGNPAGRPVGSRNKSSIFLEELFNGQGEALVHKAIDMALKGDTTAIRLCLDRICPPRKERTIDLPLPPITDGQDLSAPWPPFSPRFEKGASRRARRKSWFASWKLARG